MYIQIIVILKNFSIKMQNNISWFPFSCLSHLRYLLHLKMKSQDQTIQWKRIINHLQVMVGFRTHLQCLPKTTCSYRENHDVLMISNQIDSVTFQTYNNMKKFSHIYLEAIICSQWRFNTIYLDKTKYNEALTNIPEWPDYSQHASHHLLQWRQGQEESGWFSQQDQQYVCTVEPGN